MPVGRDFVPCHPRGVDPKVAQSLTCSAGTGLKEHQAETNEKPWWYYGG